MIRKPKKEVITFRTIYPDPSFRDVSRRALLFGWQWDSIPYALQVLESVKGGSIYDKIEKISKTDLKYLK